MIGYSKLSKAELDKLYDEVDVAAIKEVMIRELYGTKGYKKNIDHAYNIFDWLIKRKDEDADAYAGLYYYAQKRYKEAVPWFERYIKNHSNGLVFAFEDLGWCYYHLKRLNDAVKVFEPAAKTNSINALRGLYGASEELCNYKKAFECLKKLDQLGDHTYVCYGYGYAYLYGRGVEEDHYKAYKYFYEGYEQGDVLCEYYVAHCLLYGYGHSKNEAVAFDMLDKIFYIKKASKFTKALAALDLGYCYKEGIYVEQDLFKAFTMFNFASQDADLEDAEYEIALAYYYGNGIHQDYHMAYIHAEKACEINPHSPAEAIMKEAKRRFMGGY